MSACKASYRIKRSGPVLCIQPTDLKQSSMYLLSVGEFKYDSSLGIFYDVSSNENLTLDKNEL